MEMNIWLGQLTTIAMIALALGFDAFSLGIGIGLKGIRYLHILRMGVIVGLFHMIMPIGGMLMGKMMSSVLGEWAVLGAGLLLILLGVHMIINSFKKDEAPMFNYHSFWGLLLLAFSVSVDSFSVGITLGMFQLPLWLTVLLFGCFGAGMSMLGLTVGRRVGHTLGDYGELLGGIILIVFGVYFVV